MSQGSYMFQAEPRAVQTTHARAKYREKDIPNATLKANIMADKRVVRGNTYAAAVIPAGRIPPASTMPSSATRRPMHSTLKQTTRSQMPVAGSHDETGRISMQVQTDDYLEELVDQVFEQDSTTQTELLEDLPLAPIFLPKSYGHDASTSIEPGELFDFNVGVEPILEVLVGKALDQGFLQVMEEEELKLLQGQRLKFEQERDAVLVEAQLLEAASIRRHEEKERRLAQERERLAREKEVAKKVAAATAAKNFMSGLQNAVFNQLEAGGHFYDPVVRQVEHQFMPWLHQQVSSECSLLSSCRRELDQILFHSVQTLVTQVEQKQAHEQQLREEAELKAAQQQEEERTRKEEKEREKQEAIRKAREDEEAAERAAVEAELRAKQQEEDADADADTTDETAEETDTEGETDETDDTESHTV